MTYIQAAALNGIAWSYQNLNDMAKAIQWYKKGIAVLQTSNQNIRLNKELMGTLHSNTGLAYYQSYKNSDFRNFADSADIYFDSAIINCRQNGFVGVLAITLGTKSLLVHEETGNTIQSEKMLLEAISIRQKLGQLYFIIGDMAKLSEIYYQSHNYNKSILICREAIRLANSSGIKSDIIFLYEILSRCLKADKQYQQYGDVLAIQIHIQDSINNANAMSSLNELTIKYEVQKQEALIAKQEYNLLKRKILIYVIIVCVVVILVFVLAQFLKLKKRQRAELTAIKEEEKKKLEKERNHATANERERITADLHDDIGASLSSMSIYSDLAGTIMNSKPEEGKMLVDKISSTSKELMERMGDIIWSIKPADEEKFTLEVRLKNYSNELLSPKNMVCEFDIDATLAASITNPEVRKNMLLIAKEAINNIAKYSGATTASVVLNQRDDKMLFIISDNGKGFVESELQQGNGLQHIRQRCSQLKGHCEIISQPGNGVVIKCIFASSIDGKDIEIKA